MIQVFSQPVFETVEGVLRKRGFALARKPYLMRLILRTAYVLATAFVAILLPFFTGKSKAYLHNYTCPNILATVLLL